MPSSYMIDVLKVVIPSVLCFFFVILITPFFTDFFYKHKMWKKSARVNSNITTDDFAKVHNTDAELSTPRIGGVIIWSAVLLTILGIYIISLVTPNDLTLKLNFFSRSQTL